MVFVDMVLPPLLAFKLVGLVMRCWRVAIRKLIIHTTFTPEAKSCARGLLSIVDVEDMGFESLQVMQLSRASLPFA